MNLQTFLQDYREAFGKAATLPICFGYSDTPVGELTRTQGCLFKAFADVRAGKTVRMNGETLTCGGGKLYTGYAPMNDRIPQFVSFKERYKQTPDMVADYVNALGILPAPKPYLWFARIDQPFPMADAEGVLFIATPDRLSGLATWACFDNNAPDAVAAPFGSGCCSTITLTVKENHTGGRRTFLGMFDPSARLCFAPDELTFSIPLLRFEEMCGTLRHSCLFEAPAWQRVKGRM